MVHLAWRSLHSLCTNVPHPIGLDPPLSRAALQEAGLSCPNYAARHGIRSVAKHGRYSWERLCSTYWSVWLIA
jgi:hypothetical protein